MIPGNLKNASTLVNSTVPEMFYVPTWTVRKWWVHCEQTLNYMLNATWWMMSECREQTWAQSECEWSVSVRWTILFGMSRVFSPHCTNSKIR